MKNKVAQTINKYNMISQNDSVTVALSGGADSVALLLALRELSRELSITISAVHVNHNLRGEESVRDQNFCVDLCNKYNIPLDIRTVDVKSYCSAKKLSVEEGARALRYEIFSSLSADKIATAHSLSDCVETLLFNVTRGTGPEGLYSISPVRGKIIRPLLETSRAEIEEFLSQKSQTFVIDSSNADNYYSRNKIRNLVIPVLKEINPELEASVSRLMGLTRDDEEFIAAQAACAGDDCKHPSGGFYREKLAALHPCLSSRILKNLLEQNGLPYDNRKIFLSLKLLQTGGGVDITQDKTLMVQGERVYLRSNTDAIQRDVAISFPLKENCIFQFGNKSVKISPVTLDNSEKSIKFIAKEFKNLLDCDTIDGILHLRSRCQGDIFTPFDKPAPRKLKKLLNDRKIPLDSRNDLAILSDDQSILWVESMGPSKSSLVTPATSNAILIKTLREDYYA